MRHVHRRFGILSVCSAAFLLSGCGSDASEVEEERTGSGSPSGTEAASCWFEEGSGLCPEGPRGRRPAECASGKIARPDDLPGTTGICLPALPDWDCPAGWTSSSALGSGAPLGMDDFSRCAPPAVADGCAEDAIATPLHPDCALFGARCPSGGARWHDEATIRTEAPGQTGPVLYAAPDGTEDATCTREEPCLLSDALVARAEGGIIAIAIGTYDTELLLDRSVALVGACPVATILRASNPSETEGVLNLRSDLPVTVAQLRLEGPRMGLAVGAALSGSVAAVHQLHALRLAHLQGRGAYFAEGVRAEAQELLITDIEPRPSDLKYGRAISIVDGSQLSLTDAAIRRATDVAIVVFDAGSSLTANNLLVEDTRPSAVGAGRASGIGASDGASLTLRDTQVRRVNDSAFYIGRGGIFDGARLVAEQVSAVPDLSQTGWCLGIELGATATLDTAWMQDCAERGIRLAGQGSTLEAHQVSVTRVASRPSDGEMGWGLSVEAGASASLDSVWLSGAHEYGALVDGEDSNLTASHFVVADTLPNTATDQFGRGLQVQFGGHTQLADALFLRNRAAGILALSSASLSLESTAIVATVASPQDASGGGAGLVVLEGSRATASDLWCDANHGHGLLVAGSSSSLTGECLLVTATESSPTDGLAGRGLATEQGAAVDLSDLWVMGNQDMGVFAALAPTELSLTRIVVAGTLPRGTDGRFGRGVNVQEGAHLKLSDALIWHNTDQGLFADGSGTDFTGSRVRVQDTQPLVPEQTYGVGMTAQHGARLSLNEALFRSNHAHGLIIQSEGTDASLRSVTIEKTLPSERQNNFGSGLVLLRGSRTSATDLTLQDNALCGLQAATAGTTFDIDGALFARNRVGVNLQVPGVSSADLGAMLRRERYLDNGEDILLEELPLPSLGDIGGTGN